MKIEIKNGVIDAAVPAGLYRAVLSFRGKDYPYTAKGGLLKVEKNKNTNLSMVIANPVGTLNGFFHIKNGDKVSAGSLRLIPADVYCSETILKVVNGIAVDSNVGEGEYTAELTYKNKIYQYVDNGGKVVIRTNETTTLNMVIELETGAIEGSITYKNGQGVDGIFNMTPKDTDLKVVILKIEKGEISNTAIFTGEYTCQVEIKNKKYAYKDIVNIEKGQTVKVEMCDVPSPEGTLKGSFTDKSKSPITDASFILIKNKKDVKDIPISNGVFETKVDANIYAGKLKYYGAEYPYSDDIEVKEDETKKIEMEIVNMNP